jgi:hypothetical protein
MVMNERIDELWGLALDKAVPDTYTSLSWSQVEKIKVVFAELIVRECADISEASFHNGSAGFLAIKNHFGLEQ